MAFDVGFAFFAAAMVVLAGFVIRFAVRLGRSERQRQSRPAGGFDSRRAESPPDDRASEKDGEEEKGP